MERESTTPSVAMKNFFSTPLREETTDGKEIEGGFEYSLLKEPSCAL